MKNMNAGTHLYMIGLDHKVSWTVNVELVWKGKGFLSTMVGLETGGEPWVVTGGRWFIFKGGALTKLVPLSVL